jgi:hypothetical protein
MAVQTGRETLGRVPHLPPTRFFSFPKPTRFDFVSKNRIALVVSERLVNLPVQIMPPLWKMTIDEVEKARKEVGPGRDLT